MTTTRTWPYGTRKTGKLAGVINEKTFNALVVFGDDGEAYVLFQNPKVEIPALGPVTIEFVKGGPTGGHWVVVSGVGIVWGKEGQP